MECGWLKCNRSVINALAAFLVRWAVAGRGSGCRAFIDRPRLVWGEADAAVGMMICAENSGFCISAKLVRRWIAGVSSGAADCCFCLLGKLGMMTGMFANVGDYCSNKGGSKELPLKHVGFG